MADFLDESQPLHFVESSSLRHLLKFDETLRGLQRDDGADLPEVVNHADGSDAPNVGSSVLRFMFADGEKVIIETGPEPLSPELPIAEQEPKIPASVVAPLLLSSKASQAWWKYRWLLALSTFAVIIGVAIGLAVGLTRKAEPQSTAL